MLLVSALLTNFGSRSQPPGPRREPVALARPSSLSGVCAADCGFVFAIPRPARFAAMRVDVACFRLGSFSSLRIPGIGDPTEFPVPSIRSFTPVATRLTHQQQGVTPSTGARFIVKEKCQYCMGKQSWDLGNAITYLSRNPWTRRTRRTSPPRGLLRQRFRARRTRSFGRKTGSGYCLGCLCRSSLR